MNKTPDIHPDDIMSGNVTYKESHSIDTYFQEFVDDSTIVCIYSGPNSGPNGRSIHNVPVEILRNYILNSVCILVNSSALFFLTTISSSIRTPPNFLI